MSLRNYINQSRQVRKTESYLTQGLSKEAAAEVEGAEYDLVCRGFAAEMQKTASSAKGYHPLEIALIKLNM